MQYPKHLTAEQYLQRISYVGVLSISQPAEQFATWLITGTAAILGLIVINIDSVTNVISGASLRWGLTLMTLSILSGVITKQLGIAIYKGIALLDALHAELNTPIGEAIQNNIQASPEHLASEFAKPFLPPFRGWMLKGIQQGASDNLSAEKRFIRMFCWLLYASYLQAIFGVAGIIFLVAGVK